MQAAEATLAKAEGRPRQAEGRGLEGRHRRAAGGGRAGPQPGREHQDPARPADRPGARRRRDPPGQRPSRPVRRPRLEGADDRPRRRQPAARPGRYRRERPLSRFREGVPAWATVKGRREPRFPLEFVKIEPYVIPKKSLTGDNSERVDTRVLQVLYALPDQAPDQGLRRPADGCLPRRGRERDRGRGVGFSSSPGRRGTRSSAAGRRGRRRFGLAVPTMTDDQRDATWGL